jgi:hypothetical protein
MDFGGWRRDGTLHYGGSGGLGIAVGHIHNDFNHFDVSGIEAICQGD